MVGFSSSLWIRVVDWLGRGAHGHDGVWWVAYAYMASMLHGSARTIHMLVAISGQHLMLVSLPDAVYHVLFSLVATLRVARLTFQIRKLCLVGVETVTRVIFNLPECIEP